VRNKIWSGNKDGCINSYWADDTAKAYYKIRLIRSLFQKAKKVKKKEGDGNVNQRKPIEKLKESIKSQIKVVNRAYKRKSDSGY
jgi:hypothetical protein